MNAPVATTAPRRIVTGHDAQGRSVIVSDGPSPCTFRPDPTRALMFHEMWRDNRLPADNAGESDGALLPFGLEPDPNGLLCRVVDMPPDADMGWTEGRAADVFARIGGAAALAAKPQRHAAFHGTETLDLALVVDGEVWALMEEGEVLLKPGDILVQRATNHAWSNRSGQVARVFAVMVGATPLNRNQD